MAPELDPRARQPVGVEQINSRLTDRAIELLGFLNGTIGFEGTGAKNYAIIQNGALAETILAIHNIQANSNQPSWLEDQQVYFQSAPNRLNEIKAKLDANIEMIKNDLASSISSLFDVVGEKEKDFDPLEALVSGALGYEELMSAGSSLENSLLNLDQIARDIAEIYFSTQFSLSDFDAKIDESIFGLLGNEGQEYSNGTTDVPKYFVTFPKRDVSKPSVYERVTNEIRAQYESQHGAGTWNKELHINDMFSSKQLEISDKIVKAILTSQNKDAKDFKTSDEVLALVSFDDLLTIAENSFGTNGDRAATVEKLFKEHLTKFQAPVQLIDVGKEDEFVKAAMLQLETMIKDSRSDNAWQGADYQYGNQTINIDFNVLDDHIEGLLANNKLKLNQTMIEMIIAENNISADDLKKFKKSTDFLKLVSYNKLIEMAKTHYGVGNKNDALVKLFQDDIAINTPRYYEDQRSVYDLLNGKNNDHSNTDNVNSIFASLEDQIKGLGESTKYLFSQGFDKLPRNNLQKYLRDNPLAALEFLESQGATLTGEDRDKLNDNIDRMIGRLQRIVGDKIGASDTKAQEAKLRIKELEAFIKSPSALPHNIDLANAEIARLNGVIAEELTKAEELVPILKTISEYKFGDNAKLAAIKSAVAGKFDFEPMPSNVTLDQVYAEIGEDAQFYNAHKALYASELMEASKINARFQGKKLPEPRADGTLPEDDAPIPPTIGPSPLSAVIASIGNQTLVRAQELIDKEDHPDTDWINNQSSFISNLNQELQTLPTSTKGQLFVQALKETFIPIIKKFLENKSDSKNIADTAKADLQSNQVTMKKLQIIRGTGSGFDFDNGNLDARLAQIESDLPELMNPANININSNKISKVGLNDTKTFLLDTIANLQNAILNADESTNINDLLRQLEKTKDLLYGDSGNASNPATGSIVERLNTFTGDVNNACSGKPNGMSDYDYLHNQSVDLMNNYKEAIINYSNDLTSVDDDDNFDIEQAFKDAIDTAASDFDGDGDLDPALDTDANGINDFQDLKNLANAIAGGVNSLAGTMQNVFGSREQTSEIDPITGQVKSGIKQQDIRRLILLMFVFSMLEAGDWDFRRNDAEIDRYAVW